MWKIELQHVPGMGWELLLTEPDGEESEAIDSAIPVVLRSIADEVERQVSASLN